MKSIKLKLVDKNKIVIFLDRVRLPPVDTTVFLDASIIYTHLDFAICLIPMIRELCHVYS
jgi:hypothetical protein